MHYGLILAGGRGTRFWPLSRKRKAKQVLNIAGERTMIQATVDRLKPLLPPERIWILTNGLLRDEIIRQLAGDPEGADSSGAGTKEYRSGNRFGRAYSAFDRPRSGDGRLPS